MSKTKTKTNKATLIAALILGINLVLAQESTTKPNAELPPLPSPTEAQLKLGNELLDKIAHVIENVPLQDAAAVMKVFGFTELSTSTYPTYVRVEPIGRTTKNALPADLVGTGFSYIDVDPWEKGRSSASTSARFNTTEACITLDAVRERFKSAKNIGFGHAISTCCRPPRPVVTDTDRISFAPLNTPQGLIGGLSFAFDYQTCAHYFGFSYKNNEETK